MTVTRCVYICDHFLIALDTPTFQKIAASTATLSTTPIQSQVSRLECKSVPPSIICIM